MRPRGNLAQLAERRDQIVIGIGLMPLHKREHHHMTRRRQPVDRRRLDGAAVAAEEIIRRLHAALMSQRPRPGEFGGDGVARMVVFTVDTQDRAKPVRCLDQIGSVFRNIDQAGRRVRRDIPQRLSDCCTSP